MPHGRALQPGALVAARWRIERMLAAGGFGITYLAEVQGSREHVALKEYMPIGLCMRDAGTQAVTVSPGEAGAHFEGGLRSFVREADVLSRLRHPAVVRVFDFAEANRTAYMALEYIDGETLDRWLSSLGRRPTQTDLDRLLWPLLGALIQVHSTQTLHRDIKPSNIMMRRDGTPVLIDFGATKRIISSETVRGQRTLGFYTPGYAAPEQLVRPRSVEAQRDAEARLGPWTDIFALATTIYQIVTGRLPDDADLRGVEDTFEPLARMPRGVIEPGHERPWNLLESGWRPEFLAAVDKALSVRRADRPQSAVEFRTALGIPEPARGGAAPQPDATTVAQPEARPVAPSIGEQVRRVSFSQLPASQPPEPGVGTFMGIAAALAAVLLAGGAWWSLGPGRTPALPEVTGPTDHAKGVAELKAQLDAARLAQKKAEAEAKAEREAHAKAQRDSAAKAEDERQRVAAEQREKAAAEQRARAAAEQRRKEEAEAPAIAEADARRKAEEAARNRDPIAALVPGSGKSARDRLADGSDCAFCPEMVVVPAGRFAMGSPESEPERESWKKGTESPQLEVTIGRPIAVGKYAITRGEFAAFVQDSGHKTDGGCYAYDGSAWKLQSDKSWQAVGFEQTDRHPVVCVNWGDAKAYAAWLSAKTGQRYRLPSEAEREYFTRARSTTPFWWGSSITPVEANYDGNHTYAGGGSKGEYRKATVPVDRFRSNPWGLYQVHGNVWEWTEDCWNESHTGNPGDGSARTTGECSRRVVRGGSWGSGPQGLGSADRNGGTSAYRGSGQGFRLARTLNP